jgi:hypothetical protein
MTVDVLMGYHWWLVCLLGTVHAKVAWKADGSVNHCPTPKNPLEPFLSQKIISNDISGTSEDLCHT